MANTSAKSRTAKDLVELPKWAIDTTAKDGPGLCAAIALAGLENKWFYLSAASQKAALGFSVFGKKKIFSSYEKGKGWVVRTLRKVAFGTDWDIQTFTWDEVTKAARARKVL